MNQTKVQKLLNKWITIIEVGELASTMNAAKMRGGLDGRLKRTTGSPVVFDEISYVEQRTVQNQLCKELPQWSNVIRSNPEIMDGYSWTRNDFISLYYNHFRLVVEKIRQIVSRPTTV